MWGLRGKLHYTQLKNNRYLLEFEKEGDLHFILDNGPWAHRGDAFLMVPVDGTKAPGKVEIAHMPIWALIFNVPPLFMSKEVGEQLGSLLGKVIAVDTDRIGRIRNDFIRVRVEHDVDVPLSRSIKTRELGMIGNKENELHILEVKYERAPRFCAYCGCIGHGQRDCKLPVDLQEMRYTATMHVSPFKKSNSKEGYVAPVAIVLGGSLALGRKCSKGTQLV